MSEPTVVTIGEEQVVGEGGSVAHRLITYYHPKLRGYVGQTVKVVDARGARGKVLLDGEGLCFLQSSHIRLPKGIKAR